MNKNAGILLIVMPFILLGAVSFLSPGAIHALGALPAAMLVSAMVIGGIEIIDSHNASR
jgi:hypothetical protein